MNTVRLGSLALAAALSMSLAACGGDDEDVAAPVEENAAKFDEGTVMRELAEAGKVTVGTKFIQPLFGLKGLSGEPEGFDVEVAKIIAGKLVMGQSA